MRPMTRNEVLAFIEHNTIVIRRHFMTDDKWYLKYDIQEPIHEYRYAYIDQKGNIGKEYKFEVEI